MKTGNGSRIHAQDFSKQNGKAVSCFSLAVLNAVLHAKLFLSSSLLLRLLKVGANCKPNSFPNWV